MIELRLCHKLVWSNDLVSFIADLPNIVLWAATAVSLIVCGLLLYSFLRFRRKPAGEAEPEQHFDHNPILETIWMIIPVGILVALLILTFQTMQMAGSK